ncbi:MAG: glycosyltransferase [Clostridia bacterium]|nr:glycosyltransferase [Clostridia bacterium]
MEKKLSVVIPVYNTEKYLKRCIDSVISAVNFMRKDTQILVINDGSKGNCDEIMNEYLKENSDLITYRKQENAGLSETKNVGIENALGEYISFVDSDDYIDENFYTEFFELVKKENADVVICDWEAIGKNERHVVPSRNPEYEENDIRGIFDVMIMPNSCNKMIKRELFNGIKFPKGYIYEDLGTTLIVLLRAKKIVYTAKPYYKYYLSEGSITRSGFSKKNFQMIDIFNLIFERLDNELGDNPDKEMYQYMIYTRRIYEELIEKIVLEKLDKKEKTEMWKIFCEKINTVNRRMCKNKYFCENVFKTGSVLKRLGNKFMHFCINNNHYKILSVIMKKRVYYSLFAVRYIGKAVIDKCN